MELAGSNLNLVNLEEEVYIPAKSWLGYAPDQPAAAIHGELLLFHLGIPASSSVLNTSYENSVVVKVLFGYMIKMYET
jgi:hypothetical protein